MYIRTSVYFLSVFFSTSMANKYYIHNHTPKSEKEQRHYIYIKDSNDTISVISIPAPYTSPVKPPITLYVFKANRKVANMEIPKGIKYKGFTKKVIKTYIIPPIKAYFLDYFF